MRPLLLTLGLCLLLSPPALAQHQDDYFTYPDPMFTPGVQPPRTSTVWTFRTQSDDANASVLIDAQGITDGASPSGVAELIVRAQDEIRSPTTHQVLHSYDMQGRLRAMPYSYAWTSTGDPTTIVCIDSQCGAMLELYSSRDLRLTAASTGTIDLLTDNKSRLRLLHDGTLVYTTPLLSGYTAPAGRKAYLCLVEAGPSAGAVVSQPDPCDQD